MDFTNISNALEALVTTMAETHKSLLAKANAERKELLDLYDRMADTRDDLTQLATVIGTAVEQLGGVKQVAGEHRALVDDVLTYGAICAPDCDYEEYVGECAVCGCSLSIHDEYTKEYDEFVCADCSHVFCAETPSDENTDACAE